MKILKGGIQRRKLFQETLLSMKDLFTSFIVNNFNNSENHCATVATALAGLDLVFPPKIIGNDV